MPTTCSRRATTGERLRQNANLLYWYKQLYDQIFAGMPGLRDKQILEIGSGTSPLKLFYPSGRDLGCPGSGLSGSCVRLP